MEIKDLLDGHSFTKESEVIFRLKEIKNRLHKMKGFLKGLQYHKDENIDCNWEFDFNFLCIMIDEFVKSKDCEVKE